MTTVRVGVGCFIKSKLHPRCVLVGQRKGSHGAGKFALPGGHLEVGESWEYCASREVLEETNLKIENIRFVTATNSINMDNNPSKHYVTVFMTSVVADDSDDLTLMEPNKCEGWIWMNWDSIVEMRTQKEETLFEPLIQFIDQLQGNDDWLVI
eukprot:gene10590-14227_t